MTISGTVAGSGTLVVTSAGGTAERVVLRAGGGSGGSSAVQLRPGGLVRDSVIWSSGTSYGLYFVGFSSATLRAEARNVSVVTTAAGSSALRMNLPNVGDPTAYVGRVRNSIFRGVTKDLDVVGAGNQDLQIGTSDFRLAFSPLNADVVDLGGNIEGAPQVFDQSGGDLHQFPASPTIDKGVVDTFTGPSDLDGQPRVIGGAPDIGADEQPGPFPSPAPRRPATSSSTAMRKPGPAPLMRPRRSRCPDGPRLSASRRSATGRRAASPTRPRARASAARANFFAGGPLTDLATAAQTVDVSRLAADIDAGRATAGLSGDLGGWGPQADATDVTATFRSASGASLGSLVIGPVSPVDRGGGVLLLRRGASRPAPAGTRSIEVVVRAVNGTSVVSYDDGYADNLALTLTTPPARRPVPARRSRTRAPP